MRWDVMYGLEAVQRLSKAWNALAHASSLSPVADALWMECYWRAFGSEDESSLAVHSLSQEDRILAILPLLYSNRLVSSWKSVTNPHSPFWMFAIDESRPEVATEILSHLHQEADVVDFGLLHLEGPLCKSLAHSARFHGLPMACMEENVDMFLELISPWEKFKFTIPAKMRREASRKRRQLEKLGHLEFETITSGEQLALALEDCFELEARGWKRAAGSAILLDSNVHQFYHELGRTASAEGRFALYLLKLNDMLIAFEYSLRAQGRIDMLKPSFDPCLSRYSPGNVLRLMILQAEVEKGEISSYHLGRFQAWKQFWTRNSAPLCRLRIYAPRMKARLAYQFGPRTRSVLKKNAFLRAIVRQFRALGKKCFGLE